MVWCRPAAPVCMSGYCCRQRILIANLHVKCFLCFFQSLIQCQFVVKVILGHGAQGIAGLVGIHAVIHAGHQFAPVGKVLIYLCAVKEISAFFVCAAVKGWEIGCNRALLLQDLLVEVYISRINSFKEINCQVLLVTVMLC